MKKIIALLLAVSMIAIFGCKIYNAADPRVVMYDPTQKAGNEELQKALNGFDSYEDFINYANQQANLAIPLVTLDSGNQKVTIQIASEDQLYIYGPRDGMVNHFGIPLATYQSSTHWTTGGAGDPWGFGSDPQCRVEMTPGKKTVTILGKDIVKNVMSYEITITPAKKAALSGWGPAGHLIFFLAKGPGGTNAWGDLNRVLISNSLDPINPDPTGYVVIDNGDHWKFDIDISTL